MNKIKKVAAGAVAMGAVMVLAGCSTAGDPGALKTYCEGPDKVFVLDDNQSGSSLFVVADHAECKGSV